MKEYSTFGVCLNWLQMDAVDVMGVAFTIELDFIEALKWLIDADNCADATLWECVSRRT